MVYPRMYASRDVVVCVAGFLRLFPDIKSYSNLLKKCVVTSKTSHDVKTHHDVKNT